MGQDVFISYKSEEFQEADWVRQQLESGGISCWMAPNSITGGASFSRIASGPWDKSISFIKANKFSIESVS